VARHLSVGYVLANNGSVDACNLQIESSPSNRGVTVATPLPCLAAVSLPAGESTLVTLKHSVPMGVCQFSNSTCASVEDDGGMVFNYPCQSP
jgi:hypothetical protein